MAELSRRRVQLPEVMVRYILSFNFFPGSALEKSDMIYKMLRVYLYDVSRLVQVNASFCMLRCPVKRVYIAPYYNGIPDSVTEKEVDDIMNIIYTRMEIPIYCEFVCFMFVINLMERTYIGNPKEYPEF